MSSYRKLVFLALVLLVLGGGLAIWSASRKVSSPQATQPTQQNAGQSMVGENVTFTVTEGEVKKWKLEAKRAVYSESRTQADLTEVRGEFYDADGKPVLEFTAPTGQYLTRNNAVTLSGGVVATSLGKSEDPTKAGKLTAPTMVWDAKTDRVTASGGVELTFPQGKSTAQTCRFSLDFNNIILEGNVVSTITQ